MSNIGKQVSSVTLYQEKRTLLFTQIADSLLFLTRISQISRKVAALKEVLAACRQCRVFAFRMERLTSALTLTSKKVHVCTKRGAYMYFFWYKSVPK